MERLRDLDMFRPVPYNLRCNDSGQRKLKGFIIYVDFLKPRDPISSVIDSIGLYGAVAIDHARNLQMPLAFWYISIAG